jgi:hypothetical protein
MHISATQGGHFDKTNVTGITDALNAANTEALTYSDQGRLATASGSYGTRSWTYDANGNRATEMANGVVDSYYLAANSNRLSNVARNATATRIFSYDAAGNVIQDLRGACPSRGSGRSSLELIHWINSSAARTALHRITTRSTMPGGSNGSPGRGRRPISMTGSSACATARRAGQSPTMSGTRSDTSSPSTTEPAGRRSANMSGSATCRSPCRRARRSPTSTPTISTAPSP